MKKIITSVAASLLALLVIGCQDINDVTRQRQLESISVDTTSAQTEFVINKSFSSDGLVIYGHYSDNTVEKEPVSLASFKGFDSAALIGSQTITVSYKGFTAVYAVSIVNSELKSVAVTSKPKLIYNLGEKFDSTGMVVTGYYSDGSEADVTAKCSVVNFESTVSGHKLVSIVYTENLVKQVSAVLDVYVSDKALKGISLTVNKTAYAQNEAITSDDLYVYGIYNDAGTDTALITTYEVLGFDTSALTSSLTVTIKVNDFTATYTISVQESLMTGIQVESLPTKTIYGNGETLNLTGLVIRGVYADGVKHDTGLTGYTVSALDTTTGEESVKELTVTYEWKDSKKFTTTFQVAVTAAKMTSISVLNAPAEIYQGETLDLSEKVIGCYTNGTTCKLSGYTVTGYDPESNNAVGTHNVIVTYNTLTFSFKMSVKAAKLTGVAIYTKPTTLVYFQGGSFDSTGIQLKWTYTNGSFLYPQQSETLTCTDISTLTPGVHEVVIAVQGNATIYTSVYIVIKKILSTITLDYTSVAAAIQADGTYTGVARGAALDLSALKITANYTDSSTCAVSGYSYSTDYVSLSSGTPTAVDTECTVTVSYTEGLTTSSAAFKIKVVKPVLNKISISTLPDKMEYLFGDSLDVKGMVLKLTYTDDSGGTTVSYTDTTARTGKNGEAITITPDISQLDSGFHTCTITAAGVSTTMNIQIVPKLIGISFNTEKMKTTYPLGKAIDISGVIVTGTYRSSSTSTVEKTIKDYSCDTTSFNAAKIGTYRISITVTQTAGNKKTDYIDVSVVNATLLGIKVTKLPSKMYYYNTDSFSDSGMAVAWQYSDGNTYTSPLYGESLDYPSLGNYDSDGYKIYTFSVSSSNGTISASINIYVSVLNSISLTYSGASTYPQGIDLDLGSLKVTAKYGDNSTVTVTKYTCSGYDSSTKGTKTITIEYEGMTATFNVEVIDAAVAKLSIENYPRTTYCLNDRFDCTNMTVKAVYTDGTIVNPYTNYTYVWSDGTSCDTTGGSDTSKTVIVSPSDTDYPKNTIFAQVNVSVNSSAPTPSSLVLYDKNGDKVSDSDKTLLFLRASDETTFRTSYPYVRVLYSNNTLSGYTITNYSYSTVANGFLVVDTIKLSYSLNSYALTQSFSRS